MEKIHELTNSNLNSGLICAANDRVADSQFSEALTNFASGVKSEKYEALLNFIAPAVRANRRFEFRKSGKGEFLADSEDVRNVGGDFKRLEVKGEIVQEKTLNKRLTIRIDNDERYEGIEEEKTQSLVRRLIRNECVRAVAMLLSVAGSATSKSWATGSTKTQPDADLRALIDAVGDSIMLDANRLLIGSKAWSTRLEVYESSTAPYAGVAANFGAQQLADKLGLDGVFKSTERVETTSGKAKVTNSAYAVAFVGVDGATDLDPSTLKRFWSPCDGGEMFRIYRDEKAKWVDITVEHYSNIVNTVAGGAKAISVS